MADLSAADILSIPLDKPGLLFRKEEHRRLAAKWHPDRNPDGAKVMAHINALFERWQDEQSPKFVSWDCDDGKSYALRYRKQHQFELGSMYVADCTVAYQVDEKYRDLAQNAVRVIRGLTYRDEAMRKEHARYMPQIDHVLLLPTGGCVILFRKQPDQFLLADVREYLGGSIDKEHAAWILSSLYNLNCYLRFAGINHNDIGPHSYFISAKQHNGALIGGWWYAAARGHKPKAVPKRTHRAGSDFTSKAIDGTLIRITGQELLGPEMMKAPKPMQMWLRGLGSENSFHEYRDWMDVLVQSFGARRYAELKLPANLYDQE